jgi:hypothetical protein
MRVPKLKNFDTWAFLMNAGGGSAALGGFPNLILLEIGSDVSCDIHNWNPTNALSNTSNDLVTNDRTTKPEGVDVSSWKNLDLFLYNFRTYIALRLTDNGSGKTLTLSQAVYDAIKDESHLFVFDEGTMTIYAYLTNIKHWTVTK